MDTITTTQSLLKCNGSAQPVTVALTANECRLIAAAPEMLMALKDIAASADAGALSYDDHELRPLLEKIRDLYARTAIAMATGDTTKPCGAHIAGTNNLCTAPFGHTGAHRCLASDVDMRAKATGEA